MVKSRFAALSVCLGLASSSAVAGVLGDYAETTLVTNATDPDLVNPWGISFSAASPFWISDNGTGKATIYNTAGVKQGLVVTMPNNDPITGQVFNGGSSFNGDHFLFASENGTIDGWKSGTSAERLFSVSGAVYKGLAISTSGTTLYAANLVQGTLDVFSGGSKVGSFADPTVPAGYGPFNVRNIDRKIYVTFALSGGHDDVPGPGNGYVDVFDPTTNTFTRLVSNGPLNSPWGLAIAPNSFGPAGGDLLVGNFGDGAINVFDPVTNAFLGTLGDVNGNALMNEGLWGLTFGNGKSGGLSNTLYLTAGPDDENGGVFASVTSVPEPATTLLLGVGMALLAVGFRKRLPRA